MRNIIKNQSPFVITIALLGVIALIMLAPIETMLNNILDDDFKLEWISLILKMSSIFIIAYAFIKMFRIQELAGLSIKNPWGFKYLNVIPVYLFIIGFLSICSREFSQIELTNVMLLLLGCLTVGFAEEYLFRGLFQPLFIKKYGSRKNGIFISVLLASVFFGVFHLLNLTKNDNTGQVLIQVVFAMFIGFFFGVLVLKTNKLIPVAITHGLINFFFSLAFLPGLITEQDVVDDAASIAPIILTLPLFIVGLFVYRKLDKKEIIKKVDIDI